MKIYNKYIAQGLLMPVIVITLTLTGIIWLTQSLRFIDLIVNRGLDVSTFLYLSILLIPSLLLIILPIALFCSVLHLYNKLISDSELIVFKSSGISRMGITIPALVVATIVTSISYIISFYLLPNSYREFKDMQAFIRDNYASVLLQEGVFNSPSKGLTVYIDARKDGGLLEGILVHDDRNLQRPVTMMAEYGRLIQGENGAKFELSNGNRQEIDKKEGDLSVLYFDNYALDLSSYTDVAAPRWRVPEERYIPELLFPDESDEKLRGKLIAEGHHRIVWPLYNFALTFIALAAILSGQFNRRGQWKRILSATCITVGSIVIDLTLKNAVASQLYLSPLLYVNVLLAVGISLYILATSKVINGINIFPKLSFNR